MPSGGVPGASVNRLLMPPSPAAGPGGPWSLVALHADPRQVRLEVQVMPGGVVLPGDTAAGASRHQTDGAQPEGILHGVVDVLVGEIFQKSQHLHEFPLAPPSHPGLQQTAQRSELFGELPCLQRSGLVPWPPSSAPTGAGSRWDRHDEVVPFRRSGDVWAMTSAPQLITTSAT